MIAPPPGTATEVLPGLLWLRMPLPFPPSHVNLWLLEDGDGWFAIDAAGDYPDLRDHWEAIFATVLRGRPITRVLATHFHPDHIGLAGWLCDRWNAPLLMSAAEFARATRLLGPGLEEAVATERAFFQDCGCTPEQYTPLLGRRARYRRIVLPLPAEATILRAGDTLTIGGRPWHIRTGQGHSPEQVMLHAPDTGVLIAADQVLPGITPHVGINIDDPREDPLGGFLASLDALRAVPDGGLVLPSHGAPWHGLHARITAIAAHHALRLDQLAVAGTLTAMEALPILFRRPPRDMALGFALTEAVAHLRHLVATGRLRSDGGQGSPRVWRPALAAAE
ncbi:MBL fold metallo-hydrolase [Humitalea sp. 24SJ18S-53]|uniref:MBL fold metallo-hydrolase n=1 Tax=Humitalea sp. 24SJ18S-53 TaxID=3422307 RepID=UPI003D67982A